MIDIAIVGAGPAGLSAGLYAARSGLKCVLFEELYTGGQLAKAHMIENYPGFPDGIGGAELAMKMEEQARRFGLEIRYDPVERLELAGAEKHIAVPGATESARAVVFAAGTAPKTLGIPGEAEFTGSGVSYCAACDGAFFKGRDVAVIGGGTAAVRNAVYLANIARRVAIVSREERLAAAGELQRRAEEAENIEILLGRETLAFCGEGTLSRIMVKDCAGGEVSQLEAQGAFVSIGTEPRTELVRGQVELTPEGYVKTDCCMQTSLPGVFAAGDVRNTPLRQAVTAAADGAVAASKAIEYLSR